MLKALARIIYKVEEAAAIICGVEYNEDGGGYTPAGRFCGHSIYCDRGLRALAGGGLVASPSTSDFGGTTRRACRFGIDATRSDVEGLRGMSLSLETRKRLRNLYDIALGGE